MIGTVDLLILLAFIVYAISSGLKASDAASESLEEYFLAGRSLSGWQAGLSMAATQFAADTPLLINALGELAAILASLFLAPLLMWAIPAQHEAWRMLTMAALATVAAVCTSLATRPESDELIDAFYKKVKPPGFWGPAAHRAGVDPGGGSRRLARGVRDTVLTALSIFCLLVACGTWICGSPAPSLFPGRVSWMAFMALTGILLIPIWWKTAMGTAPEDESSSAPEVQEQPEEGS